MRNIPLRFVFVFSLITLFLHGEAIISARSRVRKIKAPKTISRVSLPEISDTKPAISFGPDSLQGTAGKAALSMIRFPWQDLGFKVSFFPRRPGFRALTLVDKQQIEVYVKSEETPSSLAFDLAHEFGHVVDLKFNDDARRKRWMELRGIDPGTPWYGCSACSDFDTPAGDFAETFAYLLLGPGSYHSRLALPPSPDQVRELAEFCHIKEISTSLTASK